MRGLRIVLISVLALLVVVVGVLAYALVQRSHPGQGQATPVASSVITLAGMPHTQGTQTVDANGHAFSFHGAQIETPFNYIKGWEQGKRPATILTPTLFNAM